jgi:glycine/D-amino acid oxidase-like deaminating enzyme
MNTSNVRWPDSLWAAMTPSWPKLPELIGTQQADVIIIGGGFTGLSTALHLREAGVDVAIVEAAEPGWGASGRNNGQVIPTLSQPDPEDIVAKHGEAGERFVGMLRDSASYLFDMTRRYNIDAEGEQAGWVQPVHSPGRIKIAERRVRQWSKFGAPVELLSREQTRDMLGSDAWFGGFWNRTGGHINPLALARGLAQRTVTLGGRIFANSPAIAVERRPNGWTIQSARVLARRRGRDQRVYGAPGRGDPPYHRPGDIVANGDGTDRRQCAREYYPGPPGGLRHAR